jgi:hypothetical protein
MANGGTGFRGINVKLVQEGDDDKQEGNATVAANTDECPLKSCYFKEVFKQRTMQNGRQRKVKRIAREINRNVCSKGFISI